MRWTAKSSAGRKRGTHKTS
ncbi:unnamed protein product [Linum tenue]|uniref:Uncharacterized protein n=1 Tax=Linum tenue TaxID=586396 RepID=A0AAV0LH92_9ROSI|nr:unnamed protein product [Linum tenue]CAI0433760.1 unnamed protein product [Linum tenue]